MKPNCGQWKTFLAEAAKLERIDYEYFGGKEKWEKMLAQARQMATP